MDYPRRNINLVRGRRDFRWDQRFCVRRPEAYATQDRHILFDEETNSNIAPTDTTLLVDAFLDSERSDLDPPCFVFDTLREFLKRADIRLLTIPQDAPTTLRDLALVDDRRDVTGGTGYLAVIDLYKRKRTVAGANTDAAELALFEEMVKVAGGTDFRRNWESKLYMEQSPAGDKPLIFAMPQNERQLYTRLKGDRLQFGAERRLIHVQNMGPLCALALAATVSDYSAYLLRNFFERYLTLRVFFRVLMNKTIFAMEFHIPYLALRTGRRYEDKRDPQDPNYELRASVEMPAPIEGPNEPLFYYEGQISFLLVGVDEWYWTAYCCTDTFFGSERSPSSYADLGLDGPAGGSQVLSSQPIWNPRDYFLRVLSARISQATKEWAVVVEILQSRLESYEHAYNTSIKSNRFFEDQKTSNTKRYTEAVSTLRKFHDALIKTVEAWEFFAAEELHYFETGCDGLHIVWTDYIASIFSDISELRFLQRSISQKIQTFDRMIDALVNVSQLRESFFATSQGQKIGLLTNMTVLYLPFSLSASLFSMTMVDGSHRWVYYAVTTISLFALTTPWLFFYQFEHPDNDQPSTHRHNSFAVLWQYFFARSDVDSVNRGALSSASAAPV